MHRKIVLGKDNKSIAKQIRSKFSRVLDSLQLDLRIKQTNKKEQLQQLQIQMKSLANKVNKFSNMLLNDDFKFQSLPNHPLIMLRYCEMMIDILIGDLENQNLTKIPNDTKKSYNQNNVYEVVAHFKLENFDLKDKIKNLENQLQLSRKRAQTAQIITSQLKENIQTFMANYKSDFAIMCDLLKKAQNHQVQLLQNNRYLKQQVHSLQIQFTRYKQYFKQGPSIRQKQYKIKCQLQKQYESKLKQTIKQIQAMLKSQAQHSIRNKIPLKQTKNFNI